MQKERLLNKFFSTRTKIVLDGEIYLVGPLTPSILCDADEVYEETIEEAYLSGGLSEQELLGFLCESNLWSEEEEKALEILPRDIEALKRAMLAAIYRSNEKSNLREEVRRAEAKLDSLWLRRHSLDYLTCEGLANAERSRFILSRRLDREVPADIVDEVGRIIVEQRLEEKTVRELARWERWRSLWACARAEGRNLFEISPHLYSDEQRGLVNWTILYEKVVEHPERPSEDILEDDDLFDGWLSSQRQKTAAHAGTIANEKIRNAQEVFVMAQTKEDAQRVYSQNDRHAAEAVRSRLETVKERKNVVEADLPDVRRDNRMKAAQLIKGRR